MDCSICLCPYALPDRVPEVLRCGHTFCRECLTTLTRCASITCPTCRSDTAASEVHVNFALRDVLPDADVSGTAGLAEPPGQLPQEEAPPITLPSVEEVAVDVRVLPVAPAGADALNVLVSLTPPTGDGRAPCDVCCVVDVSDSMGAEALAQDGEGGIMSHGLSLLDIVKHALRTVIHILGEHDRLALVSYANDARTIFDLTPMNAEGRTKAVARLQLLTLGGQTNLWSGLDKGIALFTASREPGRLQHMMLLTDGVPNLNPPRGVVPMLQRLKGKLGGRLPCTISTFGFGYDLDSELLHNIAVIGSGTYAFIPDAGFVGTVFVNAMANVLVAMANNVTVVLEPLAGASFLDGRVLGGHPTKRVGAALEAELTSLQFGQRKDVMVRMTVPAEVAGQEYLRVTLHYLTRACSEPLTSQHAAVLPSQVAAEDTEVEPQLCRLLFVDTVRGAMKTAKLTNLQRLQEKPMPLPEAQQHVQTAADAIAASHAAASDAVVALLEDLTGQVAEAFSREEWYTKWGLHYLPSLMCAHLTQQCNNFKDPGVQHYGGELFGSLRDAADDIFCSLPPPLPSRRQPAAPAASTTPSTSPGVQVAPAAPAAPVVAPRSMAAYHDRYAGCIHGDCAVRLGDGAGRRVAEVKRGDAVLALGGTVAKVLCVLRTVVVEGHLPLVQVPGGPRLTKYHPVQSEDGKWCYPIDLAPAQESPCSAVYAFALQGGDALVVDGVPCASFGHSLDEGAARHPFFGSQRALEELAQLPGFEAGLVDLQPCSFVRDPSTGLICGLALPGCDGR